MPIKIQNNCPICDNPKVYYDEGAMKICDICGGEFEADSSCEKGHHVCHMCRQKAAREKIIAHCLDSGHTEPASLMLELMKLPGVAMHGPEHHLLITAALVTAYCNEKGTVADLPAYLAEANERSITVPGGACGYWGICGAAIGSGIYMSIVTGSNPLAEGEWKISGQLVASSANRISIEGGPRCCKRDSFLSLTEAVKHSNDALGTHFVMPDDLRCDFYPNNENCKGLACPYFPAGKRG